MFRTAFRVLAMMMLVLATMAYLTAGADAAAGAGLSSGSRGMRSFVPPPATSTAPMASPLQRSTAPPTFNNPGFNNPGVPRYAPATGGFFGRPGLMGGLMAGFLGAGLFGLLFGHGFMGGIGGLFSFIGLLFQLGLIALLAMFLWRMLQRRSEPAYAGPLSRDNVVRPTMFGGLGGASPAPGPARPAGRSDEIGIAGADYDAFERLLGDIQAAYSAEDIGALRAHATPEMVSYFSEDLAQNASRGVVNRVSDVKLMQGDLAEAWREGDTDYATVAMRFSLIDCYVERSTGRAADGDPARPREVTEVWTFRRRRGGPWMLSAIQQTR
jgi:predicted lipid-binding transport protein (Tim44 family)